MLLSDKARAHRETIEALLNPGFRHAEAARLLADAYAIAVTAAAETASLRLKRDCLDSALAIEEFLRDTLSGLRVSREDVHARFDELREGRAGWPTKISDIAWERLASSRPLRDIADILLDGGDYWEAIHLALEDEFGGVTAGPPDRPRTLYYAVSEVDWLKLTDVANALPGPQADALREVMDTVRRRTAERFAMVVWSVEDVLQAVAEWRGVPVGPVDEATWEQAGVTPAWVDEFMDFADSAMCDRMTERGWDVLEELVVDFGLRSEDGL
jgi:hypothetical protein